MRNKSASVRVKSQTETITGRKVKNKKIPDLNMN